MGGGTRSWPGAQRQRPVSTSTLVACLFLCKYRQEPVPDELVLADLKLLVAEIRSLGQEVLGWGEEEPADGPRLVKVGTLLVELRLQEAIVHLDGAVAELPAENGTSTLCLRHEHRSYIALAYHKNAVLPAYSLIAPAALLRVKYADQSEVPFSKLMQTFCSTLRYEMVICSVSAGPGHELASCSLASLWPSSWSGPSSSWTRPSGRPPSSCAFTPAW